MAVPLAHLTVWVGSEVNQALAGLTAVGNSLQKFGFHAARVGRALSITLTAPIALMGAKAITTAGQFDTSMNVMREVSGATTEEFEALRQKALELGSDLTLPATSAVSAAEAMLEMAKSGVSVNDVLAASRGVMELSAAGALSNAEAAEIATNAMNAFALSGEDISRVADILAAAANAASGEVRDFADAMKMSSAAAALFGIPIEDLITALAEMANKGIKGQDAGTSLKMMFMQIGAPTVKAAKSMDKFGISVYDAAGNMRPMREIIIEFQTALAGMTMEERNAALQTIFTADSIRAASFVLMGGVEAFDAMKVKVTEVGAASQLAEARMEGIGGALLKLKTSFTSALLAGVQPFHDDLIRLAEGLSNLMVRFQELDPASQKSIVTFLGIVAAVGPVIWILGNLVAAVGSLIPVIAGLAGFIADVGIAFELMATGAGAASVASLGLAGIVAAALPLVAVIGSLIGLYVVLNNKQKEAVDALNQTETSLQGSSETYEDYLVGVRAAAEAEGYHVDSMGRLVNAQRGARGGYYAVIDASYAMSEAEWEAAQTTKQFVIEREAMAKSEAQLALTMVGVTDDTRLMTEAVALGVVTQEEYNAAAAASTTGTMTLTDEQRKAVVAAVDFAQATKETEDNLRAQAKAAEEAVGVVESAMGSFGASEENIKATTDALSVSLGLLSQEQVNLTNDTALVAQAYAASAISYQELVGFMEEAKQGTLELSGAQRENYQAAIDSARAQETLAEAARNAALDFTNLAESLKGANEAAVARAAISELEGALRAGTISTEDFITAATGIQTQFGLVDEESVALAGGVLALVSAMEQGKVPASDMTTALSDLLQDAKDGQVDIDGLVTSFTKVPEQESAVTTSMDGIETAFDDTGESGSNLALTIDESFTEMDTTFQEGVSSAETATEDIMTAFTSPSWDAVGTKIGDGVVAGIYASENKIVAAARAAARAAYEAALAELEVKSPSQKFFRIGEMLNAGLASGILASSDQPVAAIRATTPKMMAATYSSVTNNVTNTPPAVTVNISGGGQVDVNEIAYKVAEVWRKYR